MSKYDILKLENQMCFPLYAISREIIKLYKPYLDQLNLYVYSVYCNACNVGRRKNSI